MKLIQLATLLIVLFSLHGCGFRDEGDVEIKKAVLYGPDGGFEFKQSKRSPSLFIASDDNHMATISLFPLDGKTIVRFQTKKNVIKPGDAFYQLNKIKKNSLIIKRSKYSLRSFDIISPKTMDYYSSDGDGLHVTRQRQKITREHRKKVKQQTYRYYMPFTIGNKDYAIDVTFKLKLKSTPFIGVPGMP